MGADRQETVLQVLTSVYGDNDFAQALNRSLAPLILNAIDHPREPDDVLGQVRNIIWVSWPGGTTATKTAEKIMEALR